MSDPAVQVMVNLVIDRGDEHILLVRYDADREEWWLPATEVAPYEHPDEAAERTLTELGVTDGEMSIANVQSFRGRRGWHLTFDYMVWTDEEPELPADAPPAGWFHHDELPPMAHGRWEEDTVIAVLSDF